MEVARFTRDVRRAIVESYAAAHGGVFDAAGFLKEVQETGPDHAAYAWFTWDDASAAHDFRVNQAREFIRDLKVSVRIETIGPNRSLNVRVAEVPLAISPVGNRAGGGGYQLIDPESPESRRLLCQEAAAAFKSFVKRYELAIAIAGIPVATSDDLFSRLEAAGGRTEKKMKLIAEG